MTMRLQHLRHLMANQNVTVMIITGADNRRYLSGFTGSAGALLITEQRQAIATDFRYYEQVRTQCPDWQLFQVGYDFDGQLPSLLRDMGVAGACIGFEAAHVSVERMARWRTVLGEAAPLVDTVGLVEELRQVKGADELQAIRQAVALADQAWLHVLDYLRPGLTERQVAWELESTMRTHGASAVAFEIIVASGPSGALPHARPGERTIQPDEPVVMDFGCVVDGYRSDITRTICLGRPSDDRYLEIWRLVQRAQEAALRDLKDGMQGTDADALARNVIVAAGYGDYFGHGLGHSIGLAAHEEPRLSFTYPKPIPAGAVVTVEPGIYLPGWGGVRLEDMVVVQQDGVEVLTQAPKAPIL